MSARKRQSIIPDLANSSVVGERGGDEGRGAGGVGKAGGTGEAVIVHV